MHYQVSERLFTIVQNTNLGDFDAVLDAQQDLLEKELYFDAWALLDFVDESIGRQIFEYRQLVQPTEDSRLFGKDMSHPFGDGFLMPGVDRWSFGNEFTIPRTLTASSGTTLFRAEHNILCATSRKNNAFETLFVHEFDREILAILPLSDSSCCILVKDPVCSPNFFFVRRDSVQYVSNIQQRFLADSVATKNFVVCCKGGIQANEVRFISHEGSWRTKFVHENNVSLIASVPGYVTQCLSVDNSGMALLWSDDKVVDDLRFPHFCHGEDAEHAYYLPRHKRLVVSLPDEVRVFDRSQGLRCRYFRRLSKVNANTLQAVALCTDGNLRVVDAVRLTVINEALIPSRWLPDADPSVAWIRKPQSSHSYDGESVQRQNGDKGALQMTPS